MKMQKLGRVAAYLLVLLGAALATGCSHFGHYPVNAPLEKYTPGYGYIAKNMVAAGVEKDEGGGEVSMDFGAGQYDIPWWVTSAQRM